MDAEETCPPTAALPQIHSSWHSPLLKFRNPLLEQRYIANTMDRIQALNRKSWRKKSCVMLGILLLVSVKGVTAPSQGMRKWWPGITCAALFAASILHSIWLHKANREKAMRWWTLTVAAHKLVYMLGAAVTTLSYFDEDPFVGQSCLWITLNTGGILSAIWPVFEFPPLFHQHMWLHTLIVLAQMKLSGAVFCTRLMNEAATSGQQVLSLCSEPFFALDGVLASAKGLVTPFSVGPVAARSPMSICLGVVVFCQLGLAWWLPTAVVYASERKSRARFLLREDDDQGEEHFLVKMEDELQQIQGVLGCVYGVTRILAATVVSVVFLVATWHLLVLCLY